MHVLKTTLGKKDEKMQASKINQRSLNKIYLDNIFSSKYWVTGAQQTYSV